MATSETNLRQRRSTRTEKGKETVFINDETENRSKKETSIDDENDLLEVKSTGIGWKGAFCFLMVARYYSALYNNIHDCDEVFNYWEPLHYLLYKSGFQTWEYRSYLYLLLHAVVGGPLMLLSNIGITKVQVFYTVRLTLGLLSASTEATLVDAANKRFGPRVGMYTLMDVQ